MQLLIAAAKLAPAMVAGCTVVFKPAPERPPSTPASRPKCSRAGGLPKGV